MQADVQRIIEIYRRNGRFDVTVVPKIIDRPNNRVDLVFEINEGDKTGDQDAHLRRQPRLFGLAAQGRDQDLATSDLLSFLQTTDIYDPDRIEADRDLMRRFYLKHGYADVQVVSATGDYDPAQKGFIITFTIEEGAHYHFGSDRHSVQRSRRRCRGTLRSMLRTRSRRRLQRRSGRKDRSRT